MPLRPQIEEKPGEVRIRMTLPASITASALSDGAILVEYPFYLAVPAGSTPTLRVDDLDLEEAGPNHLDHAAFGPVLRIASSGVMRDVAFVVVRFCPLQARGSRLAIARRVDAVLTYDAARAARPIEDSPLASVYDTLFRNQWRDKGGVPTPPKPNASWKPPSPIFTVYKVLVRERGISMLDWPALRDDTDWDLATLDPRNVHLYNLGNEVPLRAIGEADGRFDPGDAFFFYGVPITGENLSGVWQKGDFTDTNVYWLVCNGAPGARMATVDGSPTHGYLSERSVRTTSTFEEDKYIVGFVPATDSDHWLWKQAMWIGSDNSQAVQSHTLTVPWISSAGTFSCSLSYEVKGISVQPTNPDHHILVKVNGNLVDDASFDDFGYLERTVSFPQSYLGGPGTKNVTVTLEVTDPALLGNPSDVVASNWFRLTYRRTLKAWEDALEIPSPQGGHRFTASGFTSSRILGMDVSNPAGPVFISGGVVSVDGTGQFGYTFERTVPLGGATYRVEVPQVPAPSAFVADIPSDLTSLDPHWVLIAPQAWLASPVIASYVAHRQSLGLIAVAVAIEDIEDEWSYGIATPFAIRDFLQYLYGKSAPPRLTYALLVGDAEFDYKDALNDGSLNYVPTVMVADPGQGSALNPFGMHSFDNSFGAFLGADDLPEVLIGRIPVKSQQEAEDALGKILAYETSSQDPAWLARMVFLAGCRDAAWWEPYQDANAALTFPQPPHVAEKMYVAQPPWSCATIDGNGNGQNDVVERFNAGTGVLSWIGHGGFLSWEGVLSSPADVDLLLNTTQPSVVLNANCYTGAFYHSYVTTVLMEDLMRRPTGIVGGLAPGSFMYGFEGEHATKPFYDLFFGRYKERALGKLFYNVYATLEADGNSRLTQGLVAFGDPAIAYPLPTPAAPLNLTVTSTACRSFALAWDPPDTLDTYTYDVYRATSAAGPYTLLTTTPATSYADKALIYGNTYFYYVSALDSRGFEGKGSSTASLFAVPCPPAAPQGLVCSDPRLGGRLLLSWTAVAEPEVTGYRVYFGTSSGAYPQYVDPGNVTTYKLEGLQDAVTYFMAVSCLSTVGSQTYESALSNEVSCTTSHALGWSAPREVYPLLCAKETGGAVRLQFDLPQLDIWGALVTVSRCSVYRSTSANFVPDRSDASADRLGGYIDASTCGGGTCSVVDSTPPAAAFYYATCETALGEESSIGRTPPTYPGHFSYFKMLGRYNLVWDPVTIDMDGKATTIVRYDVFRDLLPVFRPDPKNGSNRVGTTTMSPYLDIPPDSQPYYYHVMAVDAVGNTGPH